MTEPDLWDGDDVGKWYIIDNDRGISFGIITDFEEYQNDSNDYSFFPIYSTKEWKDIGVASITEWAFPASIYGPSDHNKWLEDVKRIAKLAGGLEPLFNNLFD